MFGGTFGGGGGFGASNQPQQQQTTFGFGQQQPQQQQTTFGFGQPQQQQPATPFGASASTSAFGAPSATTSAFGAPSGSATTGSIFGAPSTAPRPSGGFGFGGTTGTTSTTPSFGGVFGSSPSSGFGTSGQSAPTFGQTPSTSATTGTFGGLGASGLTATNQGTGNPIFTPRTETERVGASTQTLTYYSISAMPAYDKFCFEELRWQDYQMNKKTPSGPAAGGFGATSVTGFGGATTTGFGATGSSGSLFGGTQQSSGIFGSAQPQTQSSAGFGSTGTSTFGATSQAAGTTAFGSTGTSLFGASSQQQQQKPGFGFGSAASTSTQPTNTGFGFGATSNSSAPAGGPAFGFGQQQQTQQQQAPQSGFGGFGSTNTGVTSSTPSFSFGGTAQPSTTTTTPFGQQQQQQQQSKPSFGFGAAQAAATSSAPSFSFGGATGTAGTTATSFGTGGAQQQKPTFGFGIGTATGNTGSFASTTPAFGTQQPSTGTSLFGQTQQTQQSLSSGTSLFGGLGQPQQPSTLGSTMTFGTKPATSFGTTGSGFGASTTPSLSLGSSTTGLSGGLGLGSSSALGGFGTSTGLGVGPGTAASFGSSLTQQPTQAQPTLVASIDKTPYGVNPLFASVNLSTSHSNKQDVIGAIPVSTSAASTTKQKKPALLPASYKVTPRGSSKIKLRGFAANSLEAGTLGNGSAGVGGLTPSGAKKFHLFDGSVGGKNEDVLLSPEAFVPRHSVKKLVIQPPKEKGKVDVSMEKQFPAVNGGSKGNQKVMFKTDSIDGDSLLETTSILETPSRSAVRDYASPGISTVSGTPINAYNEDSLLEQSVILSASPSRFSDSKSQHPSQSASQTPLSSVSNGYVLSPSLDVLRTMSRSQLSAITDFKVACSGIGQVQFLQPVDLTTVPSPSMIPGNIVKFQPKVCDVYPDDNNKPPVGQGLNVPAIITLYNCFAIDRSTGEKVTDPGESVVQRHLMRLKRIPDTEFVDFEPETGTWTFRVAHFSRYGLVDDDDEDNEELPADGTVDDKQSGNRSSNRPRKTPSTAMNRNVFPPPSFPSTPSLSKQGSHESMRNGAAIANPMNTAQDEIIRGSTTEDEIDLTMSGMDDSILDVSLLKFPNGRKSRRLDIGFPNANTSGFTFDDDIDAVPINDGKVNEEFRDRDTESRPSSELEVALHNSPTSSHFNLMHPQSEQVHRQPLSSVPSTPFKSFPASLGISAQSVNTKRASLFQPPNLPFPSSSSERATPSIRRGNRSQSGVKTVDRTTKLDDIRDRDLLGSMESFADWNPRVGKGRKVAFLNSEVGDGSTLTTGNSSVAEKDEQDQPFLVTAAPSIGPYLTPITVGKPREFNNISLDMSIVYDKLHLVSDAGLAMSRSFRVGWGPNGVLVVPGLRLRSIGSVSMNGEPNRKVSGLSPLIGLRKVDIYAAGDMNLGALNSVATRTLQIHLENSVISTWNDRDSTPYIKEFNASSFMPFIKCLSSCASLSSISAEMMTWRLCQVLWESFDPNSENPALPHLQRNASLIRWFDDAVNHTVSQQVSRLREQVSESSNFDDSQKINAEMIFTLLTGRKIIDACSLAIQERNFKLALLISQIGNQNDDFTSTVNEQIDMWQQDGIWNEMMSKNVKKIWNTIGGLKSDFTIAGGMTDFVNVFEKLDWKRALAMILWYRSSIDDVEMEMVTGEDTCRDGLTKVLEYYERLIHHQLNRIGVDGLLAIPRPWPNYIEEVIFREDADKHGEVIVSTRTKLNTAAAMYSTPYDINYHLLHLYIDNSYKLESVLSPRTVSPSPVDVRLVWLLYTIFANNQFMLRRFFSDAKAVKYTGEGRVLHNREEFYSLKGDKFTCFFMEMLEWLGMWEWSCFVALWLVNSERVEIAIKAILARHIRLTSTPQEEFVINQLKIPRRWVDEAKALYARYIQDNPAEAKYLIESGHFSLAHALIVNSLAPESVVSNSPGTIQELESLLFKIPPGTISDWDVTGQVFLDYFKIKKAVVRGEGDHTDDSERLKEIAKLLGGLVKRIGKLKGIISKNTQATLIGQYDKNERDLIMRACVAEMASQISLQLLEIQKDVGHNLKDEHSSFINLPTPEDQRLQRIHNLTNTFFDVRVGG
ncbi:nuclear protein 96-domain-containing protein [Paraphysoderma sedebokerense]|nr:nuclear protein 96-domain-containing protein [Paraphysoderma sedebokerense]